MIPRQEGPSTSSTFDESISERVSDNNNNPDAVSNNLFQNSSYYHFKLKSHRTSQIENATQSEAIPEMDEALLWRFSQIKGAADDNITEADIISTVGFNDDGELLATGDKGGRIVIFKRDNKHTSEYNVYSTFQSHEPEFDYLKSLEIEEKINKIRWLPRRNASHFLLSTNDKTIKLWKISERSNRFQGFNFKRKPGTTPFLDHNNGLNREDESSSNHLNSDMYTANSNFITKLKIPQIVNSELMIESYPKKTFANAHAYHINSISVNSDNMTFMSADDLRINVWDLESTSHSFNVVDIKPTNMEDLSEVITSAEYHPTHCHVFIYSSSRGTIRLCDMRDSALCDKYKFLLEQEENPQERSFFSEIIASISDIKFSPCGRYILSRDYQTVKLWDLVMPQRGPVESYPVHNHLNQKLCTLYENDCIFDKFEVCWSHDCAHYMTGTYDNLFRIGSLNNAGDNADRLSNLYQASIDVTRIPSRRQENIRPLLQAKKIVSTNLLSKKKRNEIPVDSLDYTKKVLHSAWHPKEHIIAIAATNRLLIYDSLIPPQ